jgi:hypothetical protein
MIQSKIRARENEIELLGNNMNSEIVKQYHSKLLESTKYVNFRGIPMPRDKDGTPMTLEVPLERVYVQVLVREIKPIPPLASEPDTDLYGAVEQFSNLQFESDYSQDLVEPRNVSMI